MGACGIIHNVKRGETPWAGLMVCSVPPFRLGAQAEKKTKIPLDKPPKVCYNKGTKEREPKPKGKPHERRVRLTPQTLDRTESCCAVYKCEPAPVKLWNIVGGGRQDGAKKKEKKCLTNQSKYDIIRAQKERGTSLQEVRKKRKNLLTNSTKCGIISKQ